MSKYSGKCDLFDHITGMGGWFDENGKAVNFGDPGVNCYYSDEWLDFLAFKKQTGGVLHQHRKITLTPWNEDDIKKVCPEFDYQEHTKVISDKRAKSGQREEKYLTYTYWGKEYTLKELNKKGIYITIDIKFDTLLDLLPYYPYIVSMASAGTVYITNQSYVDEQLENDLDSGWCHSSWEQLAYRTYRKELQDHYREVVLEYYDPRGYECIEELNFIPEKDNDGNIHYLAKTSHKISDRFNLEWKTTKTHWTSPKQYDANRVEMSKEDYNYYLGNKCSVYYVKEKEQ